ncbi:MAG: beta-ketoacyl-[acyl-carrier-protein] synthase family protein [Planctomycetota bacterium]|nr:beta-ketoacyl-[acyl-carrier-protein] synthase family protein [Planctomycetota bacterium]
MTNASEPQRQACAITGIGVISPYGRGRQVFWENVKAGRCGLRPVRRFDAAVYRNTLGGEVPDFEVAEGQERAAAFAVAAAQEAVADAGLAAADLQCPVKIGIVLGTNFGGMTAGEAAFRRRIIDGEKPQDLTAFQPDFALRQTRQAIGGHGPEACLSLSCASGAAALGTALEWLRCGRCDIVLAGGYDALSESAFAGLSALRAIARDTIRPFDRNRSGSIFSEGAAVLVVESEARARQRGRMPYCRLLGRGINNDAFHMTAPEKTGKGIIAVMRMALADAGVAPEEIAHINLHGTGTPYNDQIETLAIKAVFGEHSKRIVVTANKSLFGHAMGAAGALEAAVTALSIKEGVVPPTIGCQERDPELDLDVCFDTARSLAIPYALSNSYGLGGTNAAVVLGAWQG